jgi:LmbE family N-acetylglucosaminyl deacetylase
LSAAHRGRFRWASAPAAIVLAALAALAGPGPLLAQQSASEPLLPPGPRVEYEGAIRTGIALRRLGNTARLLHIGAHPDDENTALFSPLALGRGADAAYLSLNRGEGGQNGIGPELGIPLGLIRTEELLSARGLDGATQFFTRAIDFGFSKTAEETFEHWPHDSLLADVVEIIRRYRPDVVVPAWSGTPRDGHGQHQAAGILAREAILAAGDPDRFPEQIAAGLRPFTPRAVYWSDRYAAGGPDVELNTGELDPLLGRSYHQIAMASRSRHKSQDQGVPQAPGPRRTAFEKIDPANPPPVEMSPDGRPTRQLVGRPSLDASLFDGVDTLLSQRADAVGAREAAERLRAYEATVARARDAFDPLRMGEVLPILATARGELDAARRAIAAWAADFGRGPATERADAAEELRFHLASEARDLRVATLAAANVELDAVADDELVVPGQRFTLTLSAWNGGGEPVRVQFRPALPPGWTATAAGNEADGWREVAAGDRVEASFVVRVADDARDTRPYFVTLEDEAEGRDLYRWPDDESVRGLPFAPAPVRAGFDVRFPADSGIDVSAEREAAWVGVDPHRGEYRRPVRVVPPVSVTVDPTGSVIPLTPGASDAARTRHVAVRLQAEAPDGISGSLRVEAPVGWTVTPAETDVEFAGPGEERTVGVDVVPPADLQAGEYTVQASFETSACGGMEPCGAERVFDEGYELVDYPHIAPHQLYRRAATRVRAFPVRVADVRVGYVAGVPDHVPEALDDLGVAWQALDADALAEGDLSQFDVIVTGTRAYEFRPDLVAHNQRLLDWARAGGTLIVQYNKYPALEGSYAPWPVTIARPHGRVTEEDAPVEVLRPDNPLFNTPNEIGPDDWRGWVQERGLYFWDTWEGPLEPLLSMHDPGEPPLEGSLLVAPLGRGTYVYSALALFRQLPAGVPGGWRLLANLVSLGAAPRS